MKKVILGTIVLCIFLISNLGIAQVNPEIQLGARGVFSINNDITNNAKSSAINDFSDSGFLLGFRQKMYNDFRGQFVLGFQFPDADSDLGQIFFHQVFIKLEDQNNIIKLGRSRVKSSLIDFATLRDDDALKLTDVLNPYSNGTNTEDNQFGNVIEYTHIFGQRYWLTVHGEHFTKSTLTTGAAETDFSMNALGFSFEYRIPQSQLWNRDVLQQIGVSFNNFLTDRQGYSNQFDKLLKNVIFSTIINVVPDPVNFVDFRLQAIYNNGFSEITSISNYKDIAEAKSLSIFFGPRYLLRVLERPALQISFYGGFKTFPDLSNNSKQIQFVANSFYRLGENFDVGIQYQFKKNTGDLANLLPAKEHRIQLAMIFAIDQIWNNQFDDRESILNLEHGYIK
ncbi:MAG: hypothetical protein KJ666_01235 [Bacteroidetes bacterium]|nr:hypothetical protein [Bacteroidota bacterium]MBU2585236.1 hypothetical protein [Bacteroidota bacterium]